MEDVFELIKKAQEGDEEAKTKLITENSPLIKSVIRHYKNKGVDYEDLYQLGCIGFLKAVKNFSFDYNVKFSTYAVPMIAGEVKRFLRDDGYIKISRSLKTLAVKVNSYIEKYKQKNQDSPTIEHLAKEFNAEPYEIIFAMDAIKSPISIYEKSDEDASQVLLDKIADKKSIDDRLDHIILKDLIKHLDKRDKLLIILRYYKDKTQSEVAKVLNVSQVQVSRLESKIIKKIKEEFKIQQ